VKQALPHLELVTGATEPSQTLRLANQSFFGKRAASARIERKLSLCLARSSHQQQHFAQRNRRQPSLYGTWEIILQAQVQLPRSTKITAATGRGGFAEEPGGVLD
jgi:hypothetical protein